MKNNNKYDDYQNELINLFGEERTKDDEFSYNNELLNLFENEEPLKVGDDFYNKQDGSFKRVFKIPVGNLSKEEVEEILRKLINEYRKDVEWDESTGEIFLSPNQELSKEIWLPTPNDFQDPRILTHTISDQPRKKFIIPVGNTKKKNFLSKFLKNN